MTLRLVFLAVLPYLGLAFHDECPALSQCERPIREENIFIDNYDLTPDIQTKEVLNRVCEKLPALRTCVSTNSLLCSSDIVKGNAQSTKGMIEYICSPEGGKVTLDIRNSQCVQNREFELKYNKMMLDCVYNSYFQSPDLGPDQAECWRLANQHTCMVDGMKDWCGLEFATLMDNMWGIVNRARVMEYNCVTSR